MKFTRRQFFPIRYKDSLVVKNKPKAVVSEHFHILRTAINSMDNIKVISVVSPTQGDGKSLIAANLAMSFAQQRKKTLYVDANFRKSTSRNIFQYEEKLGLADVLSERLSLKEAIIPSQVSADLSILPAGENQLYPSERLSSPLMEELMTEMRESFDVVIFDTPAVLSVADSHIISRMADGALFTVKSYTTNKNDSIKAKKILDQNKVNILGTIFNASEEI